MDPAPPSDLDPCAAEEGRQWALPQRLAAVGDGKHPLWGPTFLVDKQRGTLWLFYSQNSGACKGG